MNQWLMRRTMALLLSCALLVSSIPAVTAESENAAESAPAVQEEVRTPQPQKTPAPQADEPSESKPTPKPQEKPQEAPQDEPEKAPQDEPVKEPQDEPQEEPNEEPVEEPVEEPEEIPAETPPQEPSDTEDVPEQEPDTEEPPADAEPSESEAPVELETPNPVEMPDPDHDEDRTPANGNNSGAGNVVTPEPTVTPEPVDALKVSISTSTQYAVAGESSIKCKFKVRGGVAPYKISVTLHNTYTDKQVSKRDSRQDKAGTYSIKCKPQDYGVHRITVHVTDSLGRKTKDTIKVPVASRVRESSSKWEKMFRKVKLTGDWGRDLVAIAKTQIGYRESAKNYIMSGGEKIGYTRYGAWYGSDYGKWCSMFIAFCCEYAGITEKMVPRDSNVGDLYREMKKLGVIEPEDYVPVMGDLIFFNWKGGSDYDHIGIVEKVEDGMVHTIEGNSANRVRRQRYKLSDTEITGYANLLELRDLYEEKAQ